MFPQTWRCSFSGFQSWIGELLRQLNDEPGETDSVAEQAGFEPPVPLNTVHLRTALFTSPDSVLKVQQKG